MKKILYVLLAVLLFQSCSRNNYIVAPPFTSVNKVFLLEKGENLKAVNEKLGLEPFDIVNGGGDVLLCYYNYRVLERRIAILNPNDRKDDADANDLNMSSEKGQLYGEDFYTEWKRLYVFFEKGKMASYITSDGLKDANYITLVNGTIKLLTDNDLNFSHFSKVSNGANVLPSQVPAVKQENNKKPVDQNLSTGSVSEEKDRDIINNILFPVHHPIDFEKKNRAKKINNSGFKLRIF
jgi:hypothetical protein